MGTEQRQRFIALSSWPAKGVEIHNITVLLFYILMVKENEKLGLKVTEYTISHCTSI